MIKKVPNLRQSLPGALSLVENAGSCPSSRK
jgi:hypothetical protein